MARHVCRKDHLDHKLAENSVQQIKCGMSDPDPGEDMQAEQTNENVPIFFFGKTGQNVRIIVQDDFEGRANVQVLQDRSIVVQDRCL